MVIRPYQLLSNYGTLNVHHFRSSLAGIVHALRGARLVPQPDTEDVKLLCLAVMYLS